MELISVSVTCQPISGVYTRRVMVAFDFSPHGDTPPAPGDLELLQRFLNLHVHDAEGTHLDPPPDRIPGFLTERHLLSQQERFTDADRETYLGLRDAIRNLILAGDEGAAPPRDARGPHRAPGGAAPALPRRARTHPGAQGGQRRGGRLRRDRRDRVRERVRRELRPPQALRRRDLPIGLLRPLEEPLGALVLDVDLRQPGQGARLAGAPAGRRMTSLDLRLRGPGGEPVDLVRTLNSHGFIDLPPMRPS